MMEQALDMIHADHKVCTPPSSVENLGGKQLSPSIAEVTWKAVKDVVSEADWEWSYAPLAREPSEAIPGAETIEDADGADDWSTVPRDGDATPGSHSSYKTAM